MLFIFHIKNNALWLQRKSYIGCSTIIARSAEIVMIDEVRNIWESLSKMALIVMDGEQSKNTENRFDFLEG